MFKIDARMLLVFKEDCDFCVWVPLWVLCWPWFRVGVCVWFCFLGLVVL